MPDKNPSDSPRSQSLEQTQALPKQMRVVLLEQYQENLADAIDGLKVVERPVPSLRRGQVLVRIEAAPCNPSDLLLLQGKYGLIKTLPCVPGWEGAGTVVESGGGWLAGWLKGKRVACGGQDDRDGTWAEYFVADAKMCIPLKRQLSIEQASSMIVNPLSAMGLLDTARRAGHRAAVHTAGASQLGRMLLAMTTEIGYPLIHIVRRDVQVELLRSLGAEHVLNSSDEDFADRFRSTSCKLNATAVFEAVAGDMSGTVINLMPPGSTAYVYGALSEEACGNIDPIELIFRGKTVTGFYLGKWLQSRSLLSTLRATSRVQRWLMERRIATKVQREFGLDEVVESLKQYVNHMTEGKVLLMPHAR
jgi:NADPH:quinone reductase-like Zn-dependent oxidoreductase